MEEPKTTKFNNKDAYLNYLNSINSQNFDMQHVNNEIEAKFYQVEQYPNQGIYLSLIFDAIIKQ